MPATYFNTTSSFPFYTPSSSIPFVNMAIVSPTSSSVPFVNVVVVSPTSSLPFRSFSPSSLNLQKVSGCSLLDLAPLVGSVLLLPFTFATVARRSNWEALKSSSLLKPTPSSQTTSTNALVTVHT